MRVNVEESVFEHIPRLAKEMGWDEDKALGKLVRVYRATQKAGVYKATPARLVTICALYFDCDSDAERFFTAMLAAQLAALLEDGEIKVRGNKKRIEELEEWRRRASRGGKKRAAEADRDESGQWKKPNDLPAGRLDDTSQTPADDPRVLSPLVLSPIQETPGPTSGVTPNPSKLGDSVSPKKKKRRAKLREQKLNPRAKGDSPRQRKRKEAKAKKAQEAAALLSSLTLDPEHRKPPDPESQAAIAKLLNRNLRVS